MKRFPFADADWQKVADACALIAQASSEGDAVLQASQQAELSAVLSDLRAKYGNHPVLIETEADFTDYPAARVGLYEIAISLADAHRLPTRTIRISLARTLLEELNNPSRAAAQLAACAAEVATEADDDERREWSALWEQCSR